MIPVAEIFGPTIQGEGPDTGLKSIFLRVAGCNFRCEWCDSKFAWKVDNNTTKYEERELVKTLLELCSKTNCSTVILTGGNPCIYNFETVINDLHDNNIKIGVETQGVPLPSWLKNVDTLVISPKAPSSKQPDVFDDVINFLNSSDCPNNTCIKIPIFNDEDFEFAQRYYTYLPNNVKFYLNVGNPNVNKPGDIYEDILSRYELLINKVMNSNMSKVYVMPQVHTLVWGNKQGV